MPLNQISQLITKNILIRILFLILSCLFLQKLGSKKINFTYLVNFIWNKQTNNQTLKTKAKAPPKKKQKCKTKLNLYFFF